jgi:hypothetical protein
LIWRNGTRRFFGDVKKQKREMEGLCALDLLAEKRSLTEDERINKEDYSRELERSVYLEEVSSRQKSRALWLREGDNNTNFFHHLANLHSRNNSVESLVVDGNMTDDSVVIKDHIVNFYRQLYSEQYMWRLIMDDLSFLSIDDGERTWMEREFEESEVMEVVRNFNGDKAPRLDEFSMAFIQKCWRF